MVLKINECPLANQNGIYFQAHVRYNEKEKEKNNVQSLHMRAAITVMKMEIMIRQE